METVQIQCPYCFEFTEIAIEPDVEGVMVQDCEVCCRPWHLNVSRRRGVLRVRVERAQ